MSAIGGMIQWETKSFDSRPLFEMSRAMRLRGGAMRCADLRGSVALLQHTETKASEHFPFSLNEDGARLVAVIDGAPRLSPLGEDLGDALYDPADPVTILRAYRQLGSALADSLEGDFALAVANEARGELYLARDRDGARPLFYRTDEQGLLFASSACALLRAEGALFRVDASALRAHLRSPCGVYFAEDLYSDLSSLPEGCGAIFSRMGLKCFPLKPATTQERKPTAESIPLPEVYVPNEEALASMLTELLFAFEYPEFDHLMPSLLHELSIRREQGCPSQLWVEDPMLYLNVRYAKVRSDRIGALKRLTLTPTVPERSFVKEKDLRRLEKTLRSLLGSTDTQPLRALLGNDWSEGIIQEKNTARRIRMEGMAYQMLLWLRHFPLRIS